MFDGLFGKLSDIGKIPTKVVIFLFLSSTSLLFAPEAIIQRLRLQKVLDDYGMWVGVICLLSGVFLLINFGAWAIKKRSESKKKAERMSKSIAHIDNLDYGERAVLREYFLHAQETLPLPIDDAVVAGLIAKSILHQVGAFGERSFVGCVFPIALSDHIVPFLTPDKVGLTDPIRMEDREWIEENRPQFASGIEYRTALRAGPRRRRY